ncbi:uncharacterized protein CEXT_440541 [Caerostris extrusa]|uniref:F-box associated domain-containing protein n=1 Tax=Caerostris extrusa TaxID=172846 RepID=A0AAV4WK67_CAEEX|nr:uncharacterized protein CEXT_440541 [Caerostris extrusa]
MAAFVVVSNLRISMAAFCRRVKCTPKAWQPFVVVSNVRLKHGCLLSSCNIVWERKVEDPSDLMVNQVSSSTNGSSIMVFSDRYLLMIDAKNGTHLSTRYLPCSWNNGVKVLGPLAADNSTLWTIVCEYGDSIEVWTFREEELLLDLPAERASSNGFFRFLFSSRGSSDGSIDLSGDVTRTPDTLALSWADSVAMVTHQAPFHHLRKTWERHFGDPLIVTGIASGYFTSKKEIQIAIALLDGQNSTLHILETNNGTSETVANLGLRSIMSMKTIVGVKGDADTILIESMSPYGSDGKNSSNSLSENTRHFFTIKYTKKGFVFKDVVMAEVYASSLNQFAEGSANLLIASGDPDAGTSINRYIIMSDLQDPCD